MSTLNVSAIITACDKVARRTTMIGGGFHGSAWLFDKVMRAFDNSHLPAQSITYAVTFNAPVMREGFAEIDREGNLRMWTEQPTQTGGDPAGFLLKIF